MMNRHVWKERAMHRLIRWWMRPDPVGKVIAVVIVVGVMWGVGTDIVRGIINLGHML